MQTYGALTLAKLMELVSERVEHLRGELETCPTDRIEHIRGQIYSFRQLDGLVDEAAKLADQNSR